MRAFGFEDLTAFADLVCVLGGRPRRDALIEMAFSFRDNSITICSIGNFCHIWISLRISSSDQEPREGRGSLDVAAARCDMRKSRKGELDVSMAKNRTIMQAKISHKSRKLI